MRANGFCGLSVVSRAVVRPRAGGGGVVLREFPKIGVTFFGDPYSKE